MPRPESFDELRKRKGKNKGDRGKSFETETLKGLKLMPGFSRRFPDVLAVDKTGQQKNISAASPPDYIYVGPHFQLLVECKARKGAKDTTNLPTSVRFDIVEPHQYADLMEFEEEGGNSAHGIVALCLYNDGVKRAWFIPIREWVDAADTIGRDSIPIDWFLEPETWGRYEMEWLPGRLGTCFDPRPVLKREIL